MTDPAQAEAGFYPPGPPEFGLESSWSQLPCWHSVSRMQVTQQMSLFRTVLSPRWGPRGGRGRAIDLTHHNFLTR
jgi:hypothetical protein